MTDRTVLRSSLNVVFFGAGALTFGLFVFASVVSPFLETDNLVDGLLKWAPVTIITLIITVFLVRCASMRVVLHDDYIRIVNPLRTYLIGWHEIDKIDVAQDPVPCVRIWTEGIPIRAYGLGRLGGIGLAIPLAGEIAPENATPQLRQAHDVLTRLWQRRR